MEARMKLKLLLSLLWCVACTVAFSQEQSNQPGQNTPRPRALYTVKPLTGMTQEKVDSALATAKLPMFTYNVRSSRDGNDYSGVMVGHDPFRAGSGTATIPTEIVPLIIVTNTIGTAINTKGKISTVRGMATFDPTVADACLAAPNNIPVTLVQQSPIMMPADFNFGGKDVGTTQYVDAFQRANFWEVIDRSEYHVNLKPIRRLAPILVNIPAAHGLALSTSIFGNCAPLGLVDINYFDTLITRTIIPALAAQGVDPGTFPIFLLHNVGLSIGIPTNINNCCALGYHGAVGTSDVQTYAPADFDTTGLFLGANDTDVLSHEVAEWMNDPLGNNPTPAWGHTGQVSGCQNNLEVGDPLSGTEAPRIAMPNGFTYHLQELAFFSWFYGAPSIGIHGWFSNNDTFTHDAGSPCQ
jgi:hypothetical protein